MDKDFLKNQKLILEKEKGRLEKELSSFAVRNKQLKDDWITKYPKFNGGNLE
jgi:hypothetical protein